MKLQFKHQKFQADAARAVCDVFTGQPFATHSYMVDPGKAVNGQGELFKESGFANELLTGYLTPEVMLSRIQKMQRAQQIKPSDTLVGPGINLTIEMETGVGKTYTYIKTIYELNKLYGWCKFIIVVPSIAIREGVYKSFQITQDHFNDEYGKKIRFFIYNSSKLSDISHFAQDSSINCMIINSQAFNAKGADARRIYMELDEFRSRKPIDVIAKTNPILIIDEPQSVEGKQTKERLKEFHPLMTLRYSATHKADSIYNMVYRLDAVEAYNQQLVKKIAVKAIHTTGTTGTSGYLYLQNLILSPTKPPQAVLEFEVKGKEKVRKEVHRLGEGANIYELSQYDKNSEGIDAYKDRYIIKRIDGRDNSVEFLNGIKLYAGDVSGANEAEEQVRRLQIRETIITHLERERQLFHKGIKVLSLFFIDEVAKYKVYENSVAKNGIYADIFEEEYNAIVQNYLNELAFDEAFQNYLRNISADATHAGYFSIDKKSKQMIDGKIDKKEGRSDDTDAYDLIMTNKERLLDRSEPVRFIFSHSALREGWDNPNVFQICTLKQSSAEVRKRQEVGRGLRLCVNQFGERQDASVLGG
ncbi:MAG: DEAD/DEAH box helicase family protein, partial [Lentisphaeria bacterium]|nr:DEAD/DEAH box helicase family protein [Lentisphaeria bacterium]